MPYIYGQLMRAAVETLGSDPSTSADKFTGRLWYNTADDFFKYTDDSAAVKRVPSDSAATFALTNGMSGSSVTGMVADSTLYTSAIFDCEIIRSTTYFTHQTIRLIYRNSAWELIEGPIIGVLPDNFDDHGITWSVNSSTGQVSISTNSVGTGTLKFKRSFFDV